MPGFAQVWAVDFEFSARPGERTRRPVCGVFRELRTGQTIRLWGDELGRESPINLGKSTLYVAFAAAAEMSCHMVLGWPLPVHVLDLYVEQRNIINGTSKKPNVSLISTLSYWGLDHIGVEEKKHFRDLVIRGEPFTEEERAGLLDYCESDVLAVDRLLPKMERHIDLPRALIRGRYMKAVAAMERYGVPIDVELLERLKLHWDSIKQRLIVAVDKNIGVYEGTSFRTKLFAEYLRKHNIVWPRLASGRLNLKEETFRAMGRAHPELIWPLYELRCVLGKLRLNDLQIGTDGRNRAWLNPFGSRSSRNQPSSNQFIFGPSAWLRCLIKPRPGYAVAYCDYEQQEFAIAAVLSGDDVMLKAYQSADPYLEFGKLTGDIPPEATKKTHGALRARFKQCVLAVQYGQGTRGLATRIPTTCAIAARLLRLNREVFAKFWAWSDHIVDHVMLGNRLYTVLGWQERFMRFGDEDVNPRSVRNFPMQANGAEMMRLACCFAIENGVELVAPVHDGFLIHAPTDQIDEMVSRMCAAMAKASRIILQGFELRVGTEVFRYPERFVDEDRAEPLWSTTMRLLEECEDARAAA